MKLKDRREKINLEEQIRNFPELRLAAVFHLLLVVGTLLDFVLEFAFSLLRELPNIFFARLYFLGVFPIYFG